MASPPRSPLSAAAAALENPEILRLILKKVRSLRDILTATGVSRLWRRTSHRTCSSLVLYNEILNSKEMQLLPCIRHFSQLTSLDLLQYHVSKDTPFFLGGLAAAFPKLKELTLSLEDCSPSISPYLLKGLFKACPLLEGFFHVSPEGLPYPEPLSTLRSIKALSFQLARNLPESFYDLTSLRELDVDHMGVEPLIISPSITRLKSLTRLAAQIDSFDMLPPNIGMLPSLEVLKLDLLNEDRETGSMPDLRGLSRLRSFEVTCFDQINDLTWESLHLPGSLVSLTLSGIPVSTLPEGWEGLASLQLLELSDLRNLEAIPASVGMLRSLTSLSVRECPRLRHLPQEIAELKELQRLLLSFNGRLRSIPRGLGASLSLKWLEVEHCPQVGRLPWQLEKLIEDSANVEI